MCSLIFSSSFCLKDEFRKGNYIDCIYLHVLILTTG